MNRNQLDPDFRVQVSMYPLGAWHWILARNSTPSLWEYDAYERLAAEPERLGEIVEPIRGALDRGEPPREWAGLDLLRGALFFYQRMTHHWGEVTEGAERSMRLLVAAIGEREEAAAQKRP